jgi:hypothetical protein
MWRPTKGDQSLCLRYLPTSPPRKWGVLFFALMPPQSTTPGLLSGKHHSRVLANSRFFYPLRKLRCYRMRRVRDLANSCCPRAVHLGNADRWLRSVGFIAYRRKAQRSVRLAETA